MHRILFSVVFVSCGVALCLAFPLLGCAFFLVAGVGFLMRSSRKAPRLELEHFPKVSIIVPMRNEETAVNQCLETLCAIQYPELEIVVVDDLSEDKTAEQVRKFMSQNTDQHITFLQSPGAPPKGWVGKTFAVDFGIYNSTGSLILVCDTDLKHSPMSLHTSVTRFVESKASLLARIPYSEVGGVGEWPLLFHIFLLKFASWLPRALGSRQSFAMGTYLLFSRDWYLRSGGWQKHREFPESLPLVNYALAHNDRFVFMDDDAKEIHTRTYHNFKETFVGLLRNNNMKLVQPLPFAFFLFCIEVIAIFSLAILPVDPIHSLLVLAPLLLTYFLYSLAAGYNLTVAFFGALLLPLFAIYELVLGFTALFRLWLQFPVTWRGRKMYPQ